MATPTLEETLQDVEARFLNNLPNSELNKAERLFFQIEEAYWYYEDYKADKFAHLPHFKSLKQFAEKLFGHCELLKAKKEQFSKLFAEFAQYKAKIPVCGCILLNAEMNKFVLVQDANSDGWTFPRGKINENEELLDCALREVAEEIGFAAGPYCRKEDYLLVLSDGKPIVLFIGVGVPEDAQFAIHCRKEISAVAFFPLGGKGLPSTYHVLPFLEKLRAWVRSRRSPMSPSPQPKPQPQRIKARPAPSADGSSSSSAFQLKSPGSSRRGNNAFDQRSAATFQEDAAAGGWSVQDMFKANAALTGKVSKYDGNPHAFGAFHPRFTDYGSRSSAGVSVLDADLAFSALSQQSKLTGERMLRGREASEGAEEAMAMLALPLPMPVPALRTGALFKMVWDKHRILSAVDHALRDSSSAKVSSASA